MVDLNSNTFVITAKTPRARLDKVDNMFMQLRAQHYCFKDRVGRSGRVLRLTHLNVNISLNIYDRNTYEIPKNSSFPH